MEAFRSLEIDAVVAIGGDGSLSIAKVLAEKGLRIVGVPKTIDNDLHQTVITFGFDTAVSFATQCLDRLHSTAASHQRIIVVEVMGRYAGWIALNSGISGSADAILIPEIPYDLEKVAQSIMESDKRGKNTPLWLPPKAPGPREDRFPFWRRKLAGKNVWVGSVKRLRSN